MKDVTQQLALLEEENALLRNIGLASSLQGGPQGAPVGAEQDGVINKDEAIAVLTRRARQLERKLEAVTSDMHHAMGQLIVTVVRARDLPMEGSTLPSVHRELFANRLLLNGRAIRDDENSHTYQVLPR